MIILGFDPGIAIVGFGVIKKEGNQIRPLQYGSIQTKAGLDTGIRLKQVYDAAKEIIQNYQPEAVSIEKLYFNKNVTTAFTVGQARGVLMLAAVEANLPIFEYTPLQIKQAIVGYGRAEKKQIQEMVRMYLSLKEVPKPDDVADALAIAICHVHSAKMTAIINKGNSK
ncbi:crossover junction endodeoxyribonuclease RuvC [Tepidibacillus infernus]|uniref:Crossover junction endodeoxyribonuclease RuvC n=1 Tax=Tepidibacillus decaturensis TaxID=1413211 RepID=A0A135L242_9BACI|nr:MULTISPECIES: crossover junction endodeoxyribonuclease RuvC [Tepidibacillus]KXG43081.1 crossover junction endodeoxyribonuclease RuvC [Tepidibacillus decaturensis]GBF10018.1 crossover junction endodeoxyribonuclease RuvC [Tepidibacillus sp. HK-1]